MSNLSVHHYKTALTKLPQLPFRELRNWNFRIVLNNKYEPVRYFGSSSVVFKITDGAGFYALKCYTTELNCRWEYLQKVHHMLRSLQKDWIAPYEIYENELTVQTDETKFQSCNILLMPWIEGERLNDFVQLCCSRQSLHKNLGGITQSLIELANKQIGQPFSHGNISPDNIIITPQGKMILIDHDSFTFEGWESTKGQGGWNYAYQHPGRDPRQPYPDADHFSFLVLATSLKALELNPGLFGQFNSCNGLLFNADDFKYPGQSILIREIKKMDNPELQDLLQLMLIQLKNRATAIPGLLDCINNLKQDLSDKVPELCSTEPGKKQENPLYNIQTKTSKTTAPVINLLQLIAGNNLQKEEYFRKELEKDILEKERLLKEAHRREQLRLIEQQNKELQIAELEREQLLKESGTREEHQNPEPENEEWKKKANRQNVFIKAILLHEASHEEKFGTKEFQRNSINQAYQKQRKKIRSGVVVALSSILVIIMGIKILFPGTVIVRPVDYQKPGSTGKKNSDEKIKDLNDEATSEKNDNIIKSVSTGDANNDLAGTQKEANGKIDKSSLYLPVQINRQTETVQESQTEKTGARLLDENKKSRIYPGKKNKGNSVTFRKSGF